MSYLPFLSHFLFSQPFDDHQPEVLLTLFTTFQVFKAGNSRETYETRHPKNPRSFIDVFLSCGQKSAAKSLSYSSPQTRVCFLFQIKEDLSSFFSSSSPSSPKTTITITSRRSKIETLLVWDHKWLERGLQVLELRPRFLHLRSGSVLFANNERKTQSSRFSTTVAGKQRLVQLLCLLNYVTFIRILSMTLLFPLINVRWGSLVSVTHKTLFFGARVEAIVFVSDKTWLVLRALSWFWCCIVHLIILLELFAFLQSEWNKWVYLYVDELHCYVWLSRSWEEPVCLDSRFHFWCPSLWSWLFPWFTRLSLRGLRKKQSWFVTPPHFFIRTIFETENTEIMFRELFLSCKEDQIVLNDVHIL